MHIEGDYIEASGGNERRFCCPFCPDIKGEDYKHNLYVHSCEYGDCVKCIKANQDLRGFYICGRCGTKGYAENIGKNAHKSFHIPYEVIGLILVEEEKKNNNAEVKPDCELIELKPYMQAYRYLIQRGITEWHIDHYQLKLGTGRYTNRIIIPNIDAKGKWTYFVARSIEYKPKLRYIAADADIANKNEQVFNLAGLESDFAIVMEGVFSAMVASKDAVATYGKNVDDYQVTLIANSGIKTVYCCLDPDARKENYELAERFHRKGLQVYIIELPDGYDAADLGKDAFLEYMMQAKPFAEYSKFELIALNSAMHCQLLLQQRFENGLDT